MSWLLFGIEGAALLAGGSYLYARHRQRWRNWVPQEDPAKWTGHGIDAAQLKPRLAEVRHDYVAARRVTGRVAVSSALLALARRTVLRLGYFQHREPEEPAHAPGA